MHWYFDVLKKYVVFSGRASRQEFWMFVLFNVIIAFVLSLIDNLLWQRDFLSTIYGLAVLLPSLAVQVRRLHDTGRSGWWWLIILVPLVGFIVLIAFYVLDSTEGENQYGPNPKLAPAA